MTASVDVNVSDSASSVSARNAFIIVCASYSMVIFPEMSRSPYVGATIFPAPPALNLSAVSLLSTFTLKSRTFATAVPPVASAVVVGAVTVPPTVIAPWAKWNRFGLDTYDGVAYAVSVFSSRKIHDDFSLTMSPLAQSISKESQTPPFQV